MMSSIKRRRIEEKQQPASNDHVHEMKVLINTLSLDSLAQIFMLLPISGRLTMGEVCSRWHEACQLAWSDIKKYECSISLRRAYNNRLLTQLDVEKILMYCGVHLNELILSEVCDSSIMPVVVNQCKNLTKLEIFIDCRLENNTDFYIQACTRLSKLEYIKIKIINPFSDKISSFFSEIISALPQVIEEIHLFSHSECHRIKLISMNLKKFYNLQKLTMSGFELNNIIQEILKIETLVYLNIKESQINNKKLVFDRLVNLEYIIFDIAGPLEDTVILNVLNNIFRICKNLKHLELSKIELDEDNSFDDESEILVENWSNLKNLVYLTVCWEITDEFAIQMVNYCKNLKYLDLSLDDFTSDIALKILTKLENLESLKFPSDIDVSDELFIAILNNCKKLKYLKMSECNIIRLLDGIPLSSTSIILDDLSKLQYLEHLDLSNVKNKIQDSTVIAIANSCKYLKYLNITGNREEIAEISFNALTNLEKLRELHVSDNDNVTDNFIVKLKNMKRLYCGGCKKLTDAGVIQFIKNCPDLETLDLSNMDNITIDTIITADQATKNRINDKYLSLEVDLKLIDKIDQLKLESDWLLLEK